MPMDSELFLKATADIEGISKTLFNLFSYLGKTSDLSEIDLLIQAAQNHLTLVKMAEIAEKNGFQTRAFDFRREHMIFAPIILFKQNRLISVLGKKSDTHYHCMDSISGFFEAPINSIIPAENDSRQALLVDIAPTVKDPEANLRKTSADLVLQVLFESKIYLILIATCAVINFGLSALIPYLSQLLLDEVLRTSDHKTLLMCLLGIVVSVAGIIVFEFLKNRYANLLSLQFDQKFSTFLYKRALLLKPKELSKVKVGGILNRLNEAEKIRHFFSTESINKIINFISVVVYMAILAFYSPYIALIPLAYIILLFAVQKVLQTRIYKFNLEHFNVGTKLNTFISDSISKILAIKAFNANRKVSSDWDQIVVKSAEASQSVSVESAKASVIVEALSQATNVGVIWVAIYLLFSQSIHFTAGQLFAVTQYISHITGPASSLISFVISFADLKLSLDKINDILFPSGKVLLEDAKKHCVPIEGKVRLDQVGFKYGEQDPWVLKNISLTIYPGQVIALVGKSGSGKTTLANLIAGDMDPTTGKIFFDHFDKAFIDLDYLRTQIGYVQQGTELFSGSIRNNIAFRDDSPDPELLSFARKHSYSDSFIDEFPQGEETYLSEGGMGLSGGQKQRIAIARVLYMNPKILILDEATSALDSDSETEIVKNIKTLAKNRTTIVIAHRLTTIKDAHNILVLDQGTIVQEGTHNQLIRAEGLYKELFQDQSG
jgi:ATP-binding cassette subfamily B protein